MPEVNSPASASPSQLAGLNSSAASGSDDSGASGSGGSPSQLAGGSQGQQPDVQAAKSSADAKLNKDIQALRSMEAALMEMAQSYPTATKALRNASDALRSAQRQIVSGPGMSEPPMPNTTA